MTSQSSRGIPFLPTRLTAMGTVPSHFVLKVAIELSGPHKVVGNVGLENHNTIKRIGGLSTSAAHVDLLRPFLEAVGCTQTPVTGRTWTTYSSIFPPFASGRPGPS
jgi:hypothetical protein